SCAGLYPSTAETRSSRAARVVPRPRRRGCVDHRAGPLLYLDRFLHAANQDSAIKPVRARSAVLFRAAGCRRESLAGLLLRLGAVASDPNEGARGSLLGCAGHRFTRQNPGRTVDVARALARAEAGGSRQAPVPL